MKTMKLAARCSAALAVLTLAAPAFPCEAMKTTATKETTAKAALAAKAPAQKLTPLTKANAQQSKTTSATN